MFMVQLFGDKTIIKRSLATLLAIFLAMLTTGIALAANTKQLLKGEVGSSVSLSKLGSQLGYQLGQTEGKTVITQVKQGSPAALHGLKVGDRVVKEQSAGHSVAVTIDRNGQCYQANLELNQTFGRAGEQKCASNTVQEQIATLENHHITLLIDRSGSMATRDCPGGLSRWEWCAQQSQLLTKVTDSFLKEPLCLIVFADNFATYDNVKFERATRIFSTNQPDGMTNTGDALSKAIETHFARKQEQPQKIVPDVVAVITDGEPNDPELVKREIVEATSKMTDPNELSITFLQVGSAQWGAALLRELDDNLVNEGAAYDIVDRKSFDQLQSIGLLGALAQSVIALRTPSPSQAVRAWATTPALAQTAASRPAYMVSGSGPRIYSRAGNYSHVVRQTTATAGQRAAQAVPVQQQLKQVEQQRADLERKLLEE